MLQNLQRSLKDSGQSGRLLRHNVIVVARVKARVSMCWSMINNLLLLQCQAASDMT